MGYRVIYVNHKEIKNRLSTEHNRKYFQIAKSVIDYQ